MATVRMLLWAALLAGCSSPNPDLYTLAAVPGPIVHTPAHTIELRRLSLPGYLDRPEIIRSAAQYRLRVTVNDRWGESLSGMLARVFTENLVQRLPGATVFPETGAISVQPDVVLEVNIQRFDADAAGAVVLLAQIAVRRETGHASEIARSVRLTATPRGAGTQELVASMSADLGELADVAARLLGR
jgi:uncharacterized protein